MNYRRHLLLPLQLLALLIALSFASAQNSNNTSDFVLTVQETLSICQNAELSWSGSNILPLYEVYLARGNGTIGDNNSLDAEQWLGAVNDTRLEWMVMPAWANIGDVLRFRVQDRNGNGTSAVAWSTVTGSACPEAPSSTVTRHPFLTLTSFVVSIHTTESVTTKNTNVATQTADFITSTGTATATRNAATSPQGTPSPSPGSQYSDQPGPATASPTGPPGSNTGANSPSQGSSSQVASGNFWQAGGGVTANQSQGTGSGQQGSQSTRTATPNDASIQDTSSKQGVQLSTQAIGAIVGTICVATALWLCYALWRRKRRRGAVAVVPREDPHTGSTRELLAPSNEALPNPAHGPHMATAPIYQQPQILTIPLPPASGYAGATIPSYDEATSPYSLLGTPDPFRRSLSNNMQVSGIPRSQPVLP